MKTFTGGQSNLPTQLNASTDFVVFQTPSPASLVAAVELILERELRDLWNDQFQESEQTADGKESVRYLRAFEYHPSTPSWCKFSIDDMRVMAKRAKIDFKSAPDAARKLRTLPIEAQKVALHTLDDVYREVLEHSNLPSVKWRLSTSKLLAEQISNGCSLQDLIQQVVAGPCEWQLPIDVAKDGRKQLILKAVRIIAYYCATGYVLAPANRTLVTKRINSLASEVFAEEFIADLSGQRKALAEELLADSLLAYSSETARKARVHIINFVASTDASTIGDLSTELMDEFATCCVDKARAKNRNNMLRAIRRVAKVVVRVAISKYPLWSISYVSIGSIKRPRQRGKQFVWAKKHEYLTQWIEAATKYVETIPGQVTQIVASINDLLEFFVQRSAKGLDVPRSIQELRSEHFLNEELNGSFTLFDSIESLKSKKSGDDSEKDLGATGRTRRCKSIHNFLEWLVRKTPGSSNLMAMEDFRFTGRLNKGRTSRIALDDPIVGALKDSIVRFTKDSKGEITGVDFPLITAAGDTVEAFDKKEEKWVTVEWPGRSVLLYLLLCIPVRTFQARWCDSGVNDARVYDEQTDSFIDNYLFCDGITATKNGILREIVDEATGEKFLGLWMNTNKTQLSRGVSGYEIPWISPEITFLVCYVRDWYLRYHVAGAIPYNTPIKFHQGERKEISARTSAKFPSFAPLFRDIRQISATPPYGSVISYGRLRDFYLQALGAADSLLSKSGRLPRRLVEWALDENGEKVPRVALVDLHTLRVTGITALLDRGVPADIVAEFVAGHATTLMTLYYRNSGPASLRSILRQAQDRFVESQFDSSGYFRVLTDADYAEEALISNDEEGAPDLASLYRQSSETGIYQLTDGGSGICPGTSCSEGAWDEGQQRAIPVEGGDGACGNCRFWRTGRIFLNGQVARMNELMYEIHNLTLIVKADRVAVRKKRGELEAAEADNRVKVELHQHESRLKPLEGTLSAKLRDWAGRYRKLIKSSKMQVPKPPGQTEVANTDELAASAKETSPYVLAHWLCVQAEQSPELGVHPGAQVDLEYAIAKICDRNRLPNFLLKVSRETRLEVANQFIEFLVASEDLVGASPAEIDALFEGDKDLRSQSVGLLLSRMEEVVSRHRIDQLAVAE
jgi:Putative phage integrase